MSRSRLVATIDGALYLVAGIAGFAFTGGVGFFASSVHILIGAERSLKTVVTA